MNRFPLVVDTGTRSQNVVCWFPPLSRLVLSWSLAFFSLHSWSLAWRAASLVGSCAS